MKKIFYIIIMALCLTACCDVTETKRQETDVEIESLYLKNTLSKKFQKYRKTRNSAADAARAYLMYVEQVYEL